MQNTLIDQLSAAAVARQAAAFTEYQKLVSRAETPRKADAESMQALMAELGIDGRRLGEDIGTMRRERELTAQAAELPQRQEAVKAARREHEARYAEFAEIEAQWRARLAATFGAVHQAEAQARPVDAAAKNLAALRAENWRLLGAKDANAAAMKRHLLQIVYKRPTGAPFEVIEFESIMAQPGGGWKLDAREFVPLCDQSPEELAALVTRAKAIILAGRSARYMTSGDYENFARKDVVTTPTSTPGFDLDGVRWELLPGQTQEELDSLLAKTRKAQGREEQRRRDANHFGSQAMRNLQRIEQVAAQ